MIIENLPEEAYLELLMNDDFRLRVEYTQIYGYLRVNPVNPELIFLKAQGQHYATIVTYGDMYVVAGISREAVYEMTLEELQALPDNINVYEWGEYHFKFDWEMKSDVS